MDSGRGENRKTTNKATLKIYAFEKHVWPQINKEKRCITERMNEYEGNRTAESNLCESRRKRK